MNLDELRSVQNRERKKDDLQHLRDSFYEEVGEYIADLKAQRDQAAEEADDPFASSTVRRLSDEIDTAEDVATSIYERRMGKVIDHASLAAADYSVDTDGLTEEEAELFETVVAEIETNKQTVLSVIEGDSTADTESSTQENASTDTAAPAPPPETPPDAATDQVEQLNAAAMMGDESPTAGADTPTAPGDASQQSAEAKTTVTTEESADTKQQPDTSTDAQTSGPDRTMVRITSDVGEILGIDERAYDLATDDVVTLPEANAGPLIERDAAEPVDASAPDSAS